MNRLLRSQSGMGFIEVVMAAGVLMIGITLMLTLSVSNSRGLANDQDRVLAAEIGSSVLEDLLNRNSTDTVLTGPQPQSELFDAQEHLVTTGGVYTATWTVTPSTPIVNIMKIDLVVSWSVSGISKSLDFVTYRSSR